MDVVDLTGDSQEAAAWCSAGTFAAAFVPVAAKTVLVGGKAMVAFAAPLVPPMCASGLVALAVVYFAVPTAFETTDASRTCNQEKLQQCWGGNQTQCWGGNPENLFRFVLKDEFARNWQNGNQFINLFHPHKGYSKLVVSGTNKTDELQLPNVLGNDGTYTIAFEALQGLVLYVQMRQDDFQVRQDDLMQVIQGNVEQTKNDRKRIEVLEHKCENRQCCASSHNCQQQNTQDENTKNADGNSALDLLKCLFSWLWPTVPGPGFVFTVFRVLSSAWSWHCKGTERVAGSMRSSQNWKIGCGVMLGVLILLWLWTYNYLRNVSFTQMLSTDFLSMMLCNVFASLLMCPLSHAHLQVLSEETHTWMLELLSKWCCAKDEPAAAPKDELAATPEEKPAAKPNVETSARATAAAAKPNVETSAPATAAAATPNNDNDDYGLQEILDLHAQSNMLFQQMQREALDKNKQLQQQRDARRKHKPK